MMSVKIPLADFLDRKLVWLKERGHLVAPGHTEGAGSLEMSPEDLNSALPSTDGLNAPAAEARFAAFC